MMQSESIIGKLEIGNCCVILSDGIFARFWVQNEQKKSSWKTEACIKFPSRIVSSSSNLQSLQWIYFLTMKLLHRRKLEDILPTSKISGQEPCERDIFTSLLGDEETEEVGNLSTIKTLCASEFESVLLENVCASSAIVTVDKKLIIYTKAIVYIYDIDKLFNHEDGLLFSTDLTSYNMRQFHAEHSIKPYMCTMKCGPSGTSLDSKELFIEKTLFNYWFGLDQILCKTEFLLVALPSGELISLPLNSESKEVFPKTLYDSNHPIIGVYALSVEMKLAESSNPFEQFLNEKSCPKEVPVVVILSSGGEIIFVYSISDTNEIRFGRHQFRPVITACVWNSNLFLSTKLGIFKMNVVIHADGNESVDFVQYSYTKLNSIFGSDYLFGLSIDGEVMTALEMKPEIKHESTANIGGLKDMLNNIHSVSNKLQKLSKLSMNLDSVMKTLNFMFSMFTAQQELIPSPKCFQCRAESKSFCVLSSVNHARHGIRTHYTLEVELVNNTSLVIPAGLIFSVTISTESKLVDKNAALSKCIVLPILKTGERHSIVFDLPEDLLSTLSVNVYPVIVFSPLHLLTETELIPEYRTQLDNLVAVPLHSEKLDILSFVSSNDIPKKKLTTVGNILSELGHGCDDFALMNDLNPNNELLSESIVINPASIRCKCWENASDKRSALNLLEYLLSPSKISVTQPTVHLYVPGGDSITLFIDTHSDDDTYKLLIQTNKQSLIHDMKTAVSSHFKNGGLLSCRSKFSQDSMSGVIRDLERIKARCQSVLEDEEADGNDKDSILKEYGKLRIIDDVWT